MTNKAKYTNFCEKEPTIPIFMQAWWLEAVCKSRNLTWDIALSQDKKDDITAALAYVVQKKWGFTRLTVPHLTKFTGIWQRPLAFSAHYENIHEEQTRLQTLLLQLPDNQYITLQLSPDITDCSVFRWAGYNAETRYMQLLTDLSNIENIYKNLNRNTQRNIKKASQFFTVETSDDLDLFLKLNQSVFDRQKKHNPIPLSIWQHLDEVLKEKNRRRIYFSRDEKGIVQGSFYMVWDNQTAYALANGLSETGREKGAMAQLTWHAIQDAAKMNLSFNFLGSMLPNVEAFNRGFNTIKKPYFVLTKAKNRFFDYIFNL